MQEAFATNLCEAFNVLVLSQARAEGSTLGVLTVVQMDELMDCLRTTVTSPPPEWTKAPFVPDTPEEST